jgi:hypothetical protein
MEDEKLNMDNKAQMMVLESVIFAITVLISLVFLYQLSPSTSVKSTYTDNLKIQGDAALRSLYTDLAKDSDGQRYPTNYPANKLIYYLITNRYAEMKDDLNAVLPSNIQYNIYVSNGSKNIFWCNSFGIDGSGNELTTLEDQQVVLCHYLVAIDPIYLHYPNTLSIELDYQEITQSELYAPFTTYQGSTYDVILQLWSTP